MLLMPFVKYLKRKHLHVNFRTAFSEFLVNFTVCWVFVGPFFFEGFPFRFHNILLILSNLHIFFYFLCSL